MIKQIIKTCTICGKQFIAKTKYVKTCCKKCSTESCRRSKMLNPKDKRKYKVNDYFLQQDIAVKYYFLGLMAADGHVQHKKSENSKTISISQSGDSGRSLINYLKKLIGFNGPILQNCPKVGQPYYQLSFRSLQLFNDLVFNNVIPAKTKVFTVPKYILEDYFKLRYFLIGYIDGDGCINAYSHTNGQSKILSIGFVCTEQMKEQLRPLMLFKDAGYCKNHSVWNVQFNGTKAIKFGEFLFKDIDNHIFMSDKQKRFWNYYNNRYNLSLRLQQKELRAKIIHDLETTNISSTDIISKYNVSKTYAYNLRYDWRHSKGYTKSKNKA